MSMSASNGLRSVKNRMLHRKLSANCRYHRSYDRMPFGREQVESTSPADMPMQQIEKAPHYGEIDCEASAPV